MNQFTACIMCLLVGFFLGVGAFFSANQTVMMINSRKLADVTDSYYQLQSMCSAKPYAGKVQSRKGIGGP